MQDHNVLIAYLNMAFRHRTTTQLRGCSHAVIGLRSWYLLGYCEKRYLAVYRAFLSCTESIYTRKIEKM